MSTTASSIHTDAEMVFKERYSRCPNFRVSAPGRVNLIGEHIDYNDGYVLPMGIERKVVIMASISKSTDVPTASFYSVNIGESVEIPLGKDLETTFQGWSGYLAGVISGYQERGVVIPSFDAVLSSDVPIGGGLSSSAALEVAVATLLEELTGVQLEPTEKALLCQRAEHLFAGVPCGIMDQFASVFSTENALMLLDCQSQTMDSIRFDDPAISVLITNSNVKHSLADGEYAKRRAQCDAALGQLGHSSWRDVTMKDLAQAGQGLSPTWFKRARHVVSEIARTSEAAKAFDSGDWDRAGLLMYESHNSLRDDYEVSCQELDVLVNIARDLGLDSGVYGSRMTGGGFGGCTVTLVKSEQVDSVQQALCERYEAETGIACTSFASRPAAGAHVIKK